jgi:type II secretion system protein N
MRPFLPLLVVTATAATTAASGCGKDSPPVETGAFELADVMHTTADGLRVQVDRREVPLGEMPVASLLAGLPMNGLADIAIDLTVPGSAGKRDYSRASGSVTFGCPAGCTVGDDVTRLGIAGGVSFGHLAFDKVDVRVELDHGHAKVTRWQLASNDLTLEVTLDIALAPALADSTLEGCVRFKPSPTLARRDPKTAAVLALTGAPMGADGVYSIKVAGRVGQRKLLGEACS